jgi:hypothetical protein
MAGAVGAELPERGAVLLGAALGCEARELAGADVWGVVVAEDVSGDEMERVAGAGDGDAKPQATAERCGEFEVV